MSKYYTGVGSRQTPPKILCFMQALGVYLGNKGYTLRTGGAQGADNAFEFGARHIGSEVDVYLPWSSFNKESYETAPENVHPKVLLGIDAELIAKCHHPAWDKLSQGAKKLHTRNVYQVLGDNLDVPSDFVICYTPNGKGGGGTGQAIRIARTYDVPVFDCGAYEDLSECMDEFLKFIDKMGGTK